MEKPLTQMLWKNYTPDELQEKGKLLSDAVLEGSEVEAEKKASADKFKIRIDGVDGRVQQLSRDIRAKGREIPVACVIRYHVPRTAFKQIVRLDTGELVREEQMTPQECQENLFESKQIDELNQMYEGGRMEEQP